MANADDSLEPDLRGTYNKSTIINVNGKLIGVVGIMTSKGAVRNLLEIIVYITFDFVANPTEGQPDFQ